MRTAKTLIRLGECPGWSESSLGTHSFCWFCHVTAQPNFVKLLSSSCPFMYMHSTEEIQCMLIDKLISFMMTKLKKLLEWCTLYKGLFHPVWSVVFQRRFGSLTPNKVHSKVWSDWVDAQADLSLHMVHVILLVLSCSGSFKLSVNIVKLSSIHYKTFQAVWFVSFGKETYRNDPKIFDQQVWANTVDPDQTAPDQGLHCLPFCLHLSDISLYVQT